MFNKEKNFKIIITSIILITILLAIYFAIRPVIVFNENYHILEKDNIYETKRLISYTNGEVEIENEYLDTSEIGKKEIIFNVSKSFLKRRIKFKYEVVDTTAPIIKIKEDRIIKYLGEEYKDEEKKYNIEINEGELYFEDTYNPNELGLYNIDVKAVDEVGNLSYAKYEVLVTNDKTPPLVFRNGDGYKIIKDREFDVLEILSYGDNLDPNPTLTITGEVDTSKIGDYPMHAVLEDYSKNKTEWYFVVHVVNSIPSIIDDKEYHYTLDDIKEIHHFENVKYGIDISSWQGDVNFKRVKEAGAEFVIIRLGYSYEGELFIDKKFMQNIKNAKDEELPVGIYLYCYDNNEEDLLSSINKMFEALGDYKFELPIAFDWEEFYQYQTYGMSFQDLNHLYDVFESEVTKRGYKSILYGSKYYLSTVWDKLDSRPIWLAQYANNATLDNDFDIWQVTDHGKIDGIVGYVDYDILFE